MAGPRWHRYLRAGVENKLDETMAARRLQENEYSITIGALASLMTLSLECETDSII